MDDQEFSRYFKIILKWWWVTVLLLVATVGTLLTLAFLSEPEYQSTATLQVSAPPPQEVPLYSTFNKQALRDEIEQTRTSFSEFLIEGDATWQALVQFPDVHMNGRDLREKITIDMPDNSPQLMYVRVRASEPRLAADLANAVVTEGLQLYGQLLAQPTANTREFIEQELTKVGQELKEAEDDLVQFQISNQIGHLDTALQSQYDLLRSIRIQGDMALAEGNLAKKQAIDEIILDRETELQNMIGLSSRYTELADRVDRLRSTHSYLLDRHFEAQIKESQILELGSIQVITPARPPEKPTPVISSKFIVFGVLASVLGGILLAFFLEYLEVLSKSRRLPKQTGRVDDLVALSDRSG